MGNPQLHISHYEKKIFFSANKTSILDFNKNELESCLKLSLFWGYKPLPIPPLPLLTSSPPLPGGRHYNTLFFIFCKLTELLVIITGTHSLFFFNKRTCVEAACAFLAFRCIFNKETVISPPHIW